MDVARHALDAMQRRLDRGDIGKEYVRRVWEQSEVLFKRDGAEKRLHHNLNLVLIADGGVINTVKVFNINNRKDLLECEWCGYIIERRQDCKKCNGWVYEKV